jgi:hypothetical protein
MVGGYVLGRSKKTRMALLLALAAAGGGKLPFGPEDLLRKSPLGGQLDQLAGDLRGQVMDAGMSMAKKAASNRIDSLSDRLQDRADTLRGTGAPRGEEAEEAEHAEEAPERTRPRRRRPEPSRRQREEPSRRERTREPEYDEDDYDDYDRDDYDERDEYDEDERDEPAPPLRERRPPTRSSRPEPRRRAPRRDDDRSRRGRSPR